MLRIASSCAEPAVRLPPVHPRKGGRQIEKTHNTEGLGSENISMFFSNSIVNRKGFLPRPALFRAWGQGTGDAGGYNAPGLPNVVGEWSNFNTPIMSIPASLPSGAIRLSNSANVNSVLTIGGTGYVWDGMSLEASRSNFIYGGSDTVMPASVNLPVILYLGIPA